MLTCCIKSFFVVTLSAYAINGQKVATLVDGHVSAGKHSATFDGLKFAPGVYFYRLEPTELNRTGKMTLFK